ncbi:hypothetical protein BN844_2945 [Pseudomonas sp. SHC52]|nr:hypothetical protein BN844_2945 [Pseudomonas sp. SHC52]
MQAGFLTWHDSLGFGGGLGLLACRSGGARRGHGRVDSGLAQKVAGIVPHPARY